MHGYICHVLAKSQLKFIKSLQQKKFRKETQLFLVEGTKSITEFIYSTNSVKIVYHSDEVTLAFRTLLLQRGVASQALSLSTLKQLSGLQVAPSAIAIVAMPTGVEVPTFEEAYTLLIDGVQDPGNMGTIIRTADWFGIHQVICSHDCVDVYNAKVVQSSMGSLARVSVVYENLLAVVSQARHVPIYGALLEGQSVYETAFSTSGMVVLGNEGQGISAPLQKHITQAITIPKFGGAESLNVAIATAIICSEIRRNGI